MKKFEKGQFVKLNISEILKDSEGHPFLYRFINCKKFQNMAFEILDVCFVNKEIGTLYRIQPVSNEDRKILAQFSADQGFYRDPYINLPESLLVPRMRENLLTNNKEEKYE